MIKNIMKNFARIKLFGLLAVLVFAGFNKFTAFSQGANEREWHDYQGKINDKPGFFSIYYSTRDTVKGYYGEIDKNEKIPFSGIFHGDTLIFNSNPKTILIKSEGAIGGAINDSINKRIVDCKLESIVYGDYDNRYSGFDVSEKQVDEFVIKIKKAIQTGDKENISTLIKFPIIVNINNKKVNIKSAKDFIKNYDKVFNKEFKYDITKTRTCCLFSKYSGIMFANGRIWIDYNSKQKKLQIISIW